MNAVDTAEKLTNAKSENDVRRILSASEGIPAIDIAYAVKDRCYASWTKEPTAAQKAAAALRALSETTADPEVQTVALWISAIAEITEGKLEDALKHLRKAFEGFIDIDKRNEAAQTQVAKLIPLGLLGKYRRAEEVGNEALATFNSLHDDLAAGKIEMNLAIISARQGKHLESRDFCLAARERFEKLGETQWLLMAENDLAIALAELNQFDEASERYLKSLEIARKNEMHLTEAEILASLGNLQTFRGQYGDALRSLELSRKKYTELDMPHRSVIADLEIAEIYQILNLTEEAKEIYESVTAALSEYGMRGEEARARTNYGKLALTLGETQKSLLELERAAKLFLEEGNPAGAASVRLLHARLLSQNESYDEALDVVTEAAALLTSGEYPRLEIEADYFQAEILRRLGRFDDSRTLLATTISSADSSEQLNIVSSAYVALAKMAIDNDDLDRAEKDLAGAIDIVEKLRAPIPAEEFRMAFLADKLAPFNLSSKVCIKKNQIEPAFVFSERARSRTLLEKLNENKKADGANGKTGTEHRLLRERLNWQYSRLARKNSDDQNLRDEIFRLEKQLAGLVRVDSSVLQSDGNTYGDINWSDFPSAVKTQVGNKRIFIEYTMDEGNISAFVIRNYEIIYLENFTTEDQITELIESLRFQFETMRFDSIHDFGDELKERADAYLGELFDELLAPLGSLDGAEEIVISPVGPLFYVPFNALFDGKQYVIESHNVIITPSAAIWSKLSSTDHAFSGKSLIVGFADDKSPLIDKEVAGVGEALKNAAVFAGTDATLKNYFKSSPEADVIHLACHGEFRADSPLYSNLRLSDGFITVRDIVSQNLSANLVTLSACETGLNKIYAGEEILGLARGFLGAGATNIVMSLWTVNDEATGELMKSFYGSIASGKDPAKALQTAQKQLIARQLHPYFWSPFVIIGK